MHWKRIPSLDAIYLALDDWLPELQTVRRTSSYIWRWMEQTRTWCSVRGRGLMSRRRQITLAATPRRLRVMRRASLGNDHASPDALELGGTSIWDSRSI